MPSFMDSFNPGDKLDLQTVLFKCLMDSSDTAAKVDSAPFMACNYYYQVRHLIAISTPALSTTAIDELNGILKDYNEKWATIKVRARKREEEDPIKESAIPTDSNVLTIQCTGKLLSTAMKYLYESGVVRTRKKGAFSGFGHVDPETGEVTVILDDLNDAVSDEDEDGWVTP